jgi:hypothetical protein
METPEPPPVMALDEFEPLTLFAEVEPVTVVPAELAPVGLELLLALELAPVALSLRR